MQAIVPVEITPPKLTISNVTFPAAGEPMYASGTTYNTGTIMTYGTHRWQALADGVTINPDQDTGAVKKWLDLGAANRYMMFDKKAGAKWLINKVTTNPTSIHVRVNPGQLANSVALFNVDATNVVVSMIDPVDGTVYTKTVTMADTSVNSWYEYFFKPIGVKSNVVLIDLPLYGTASIDVTINKPGGTAQVGLMVVGTLREIGETQYGTRLGIKSYNAISEDAFGNPTIVNKGKRRTVDYEIITGTQTIDQIYDILLDLVDIPAVYIGHPSYQSTITMGLFDDLNANLANWSQTPYTLSVRSME